MRSLTSFAKKIAAAVSELRESRSRLEPKAELRAGV
jgi:hypothetical protein